MLVEDAHDDGSPSPRLRRHELAARTGVSVSARQIAPPIANAYVCAIGEKMTPATPVIVKSGRNAMPMMTVENVIGPATSRAPDEDALLIVPLSVRARGAGRCSPS